jgi:hypothetical protein
MLPEEVFLSHSTHDREFTDRLAETLRRHGIPVWYSRSNIVGAQQWHDEIGDALVRCDSFLVVLSVHSVSSMWMKRELVFALNERRFENRIVPVLLTPCPYKRLSWTLKSLQMIDFTQPYETACRELLRVWGIGYQS